MESSTRVIISACTECGTGPGGSHFKRGLCSACYSRITRAQKKSGSFVNLSSRTPLERLLDRGVAGPNGCLIWTGYVNSTGYAKLHVDGRMVGAHRAAYELLVGPIPAGMFLDHVCHTRDATCIDGDNCLHRRCFNPHHLEPVAPGENTLRGRSPWARNAAKTHCARGHLFDEVNTAVSPDGKRRCRECARSRKRAARHANALSSGAPAKGGR